MKTLINYINESGNGYITYKDKNAVKKLAAAIEKYASQFETEYLLEDEYYQGDDYFDKEQEMNGTYDLFLSLERGQMFFNTSSEELYAREIVVSQSEDVVLIEAMDADQLFIIRLIFDNEKIADKFMTGL